MEMKGVENIRFSVISFLLKYCNETVLNELLFAISPCSLMQQGTWMVLWNAMQLQK